MGSRQRQPLRSRDLTRGPVVDHLAVLTLPMIVEPHRYAGRGGGGCLVHRPSEARALGRRGLRVPRADHPDVPGHRHRRRANAVVSQALGAGRRGDARRAGAHALLLAAALTAAVAASAWLAHPFVFRALGAQPGLMPRISAYLGPWLAGFPLLGAFLTANALLRAHGNSWIPVSLMFGTAVFNVAFTPVLIFGVGPVPALHIAGASAATLVTWALVLLLALWPLLRTVRVFGLRDLVAPGHGDTLRRIGPVGAPAALANAINPAALAAVTGLVSTFGADAVAAFGSAGRIESLAMVPLLSLSAAIGPLVGQNWGADDRERVAASVILAGAACVGYGVVAAALVNLAAVPLGAAFTDDPGVAANIVRYLRIVTWSFAGYGLVVVVNAALNARSRAGWSLGLSAGRTVLVYVPLAASGAGPGGESGLFAGLFAGNALAGLAAVVVARRQGLWFPARPDPAASAGAGIRRA